jgi:hypothetical protein
MIAVTTGLILWLILQIGLGVAIIYCDHRKNKLIGELLESLQAAEKNTLYYSRCYYKALNQLHQKNVRNGF